MGHQDDPQHFKAKLAKHDPPAAAVVPFAQPSPAPKGFNIKEYERKVDNVVRAAKLGDLAGPTPPAIKTGGWNDTRNDVNADGKYLLLAVPEFKPGMTTYLRLGAACSTWESALGNELEKIVHLAGPLGKTKNLPFIDDERSRGAFAVHPGVGATLSESEVLHTKGGWRDHSDGNRITTTYGDKIEVIRGNYKMIVLGRQDSPAYHTGWDASGQHIQDWGQTIPGASVTVEFTANYGGTWLLKNSYENLNQWNRIGGNFKEEFWGLLRESYTGQECPMDLAPASPQWAAYAGPFPRSNPVLIEKTFAESITSQTGSVICPVPTIDESTWVSSQTSATTADSIDETTTVTGAITSTTTASATTETTTVSGAITSTTVTNALTDTTTATLMTSVTTVGAAVDVTAAGAMTSTTVAGTINDFNVTGAASTLTLIGAEADLKLGGESFSLSAQGAEQSIALQGMNVDLRLVGMLIEIMLVKYKMSITAGTMVEIGIGPKFVGQFPQETQLKGWQNKLALGVAHVAALTHFI